MQLFAGQSLGLRAFLADDQAAQVLTGSECKTNEWQLDNSHRNVWYEKAFPYARIAFVCQVQSCQSQDYQAGKNQNCAFQNDQLSNSFEGCEDSDEYKAWPDR